MLKPAVFVALFIAAWLAQNQAVERHRDHFQAYGDYNAMINEVQSDQPFPRWLIGASVLSSTYQVADYLADLDAARFIYRSSMLWPLVAGIGILLIFPSWASYMALTCPMLLLFSSGYSEYYPYISPIFVAVALAHLNGRFDGLAAWTTGTLCSLLFLVYVGFLPLACIIGCYALARRPQAAIPLVGSALLTLVVVSLALSGPGYFSQMFHDLNTGDLPSYPEQDGWAMPGTPFFWPAKAAESFPGLLSAISRGVGIGPMLAACVLALHDRRLAVLMGVYVVVSVFTIPRLGWLGDTDLFFQLYILGGLSIGSAIDASVNAREGVLP
jgi:hypothetical protein